jgi:NDP-sugar pyrophosphorylase family protein
VSRPADLPAVCILAGGLGSRLGQRVRDTPKPLLEVAGRPFLLHQLELLAAHGSREAVICVGYLGAQIESRIGHQRFGVRLTYSFDGPGLDGTLGAIRRARELLGDRFLGLYGDTYLRLDYRDFSRAWRESGLPAAMSVLHNEARWDTSNVVYRDGLVLRYDKHRPSPQMSWIDYGLGALSSEALSLVDDDETDLAILYQRLAEQGGLCGYEATQRFYEIGTPSSLAETDAFLRGAPA